MPTYDYECRMCGHTFEHMQSITSPVLRKCPGCGELKLQRLIGGGAGVIFKGSGFYETDYKRKRGSSPSSRRLDGAKRKEPHAASAEASARAEAPKCDAAGSSPPCGSCPSKDD